MNKNETKLPNITVDTDIEALIPQLLELANHGLTNMYDVNSMLFCFKLKKSLNGVVKEGMSIRYTMICLLGLYRLKKTDVYSPINIAASLDVLIKNASKLDNIGDVGLLYWLCAMVAPERIKEVYLNLDINNTWRRYKNVSDGKTTELSWFLTGLSYIALVLKKGNLPGLQTVAKQVYALIKGNYAGKGIFRHQKTNTLTGVLRGWIGCFADQVYPIYAFARFSQAFDNNEALKVAIECGDAICKHQGPGGQWWWHYNSITGRVVGKYPVYSVHQHAMAPMALFALSEVSGIDYSKHINRGLQWIKGHNEHNYNLIDSQRKVIWRCFYQKEINQYIDIVRSLLQISKNEANHKHLIILFECWSYELGWLLYAHATPNAEKTI